MMSKNISRCLTWFKEKKKKKERFTKEREESIKIENLTNQKLFYHTWERE
jgi:hypothetical protein